MSSYQYLLPRSALYFLSYPFYITITLIILIIKNIITIIMILGGVKSSMYRDLPPPLLAEFGFQVQIVPYHDRYWYYIYSEISNHPPTYSTTHGATSIQRWFIMMLIFIYCAQGCLASLEIHGTVVDPNKVTALMLITIMMMVMVMMMLLASMHLNCDSSIYGRGQVDDIE